MHDLKPDELKSLIDRGAVTLLDVRHDEELAIAHIDGAVHIPLNQLQTRLDELDRQRPIVAFCHHGMRSEMAGRLLERNGFADVAHLSGGIDAWSQIIDPSVPRY
jgi:rhodanese-related sulfurtransferase